MDIWDSVVRIGSAQNSGLKGFLRENVRQIDGAFWLRNRRFSLSGKLFNISGNVPVYVGNVPVKLQVFPNYLGKMIISQGIFPCI